MLRKTSLLVGSLLFAGMICYADQWNKKTILKVNETVLVPGATLNPGTYVMKLVDSQSNRHIVQITNERENEVITTVLAIPNYRLRPTSATAFGWWETPRGNPPALRAWFYPGDNFGQEFAYPKGLSAKIAQAAHLPVPTTQAQTPAEMKTAPVTAVEPSGVERPLPKEVYEPPAAPQPQPQLRAEVGPAPVPEPAAAPAPAPVPAAPAPVELPATAAPYVTWGLAGLVALAAGLALRGIVHHKHG